MKVGRLADQRDHLGAGSHQRPHAGVVLGADALAACHAEGADLDVLQMQLGHALEILCVLLVRRRIAPFDVIEAEAIEPLGNQQLVLQREVDAFALAAVAKVVS